MRTGKKPENTAETKERTGGLVEEDDVRCYTESRRILRK